MNSLFVSVKFAIVCALISALQKLQSMTGHALYALARRRTKLSFEQMVRDLDQPA